METENKGFIIYDDSDTVNEITAALRCSEEVTDIEIPSEVGGKLVNTLRIVGVILPKLRRLYIPSTVKDIEFSPCTTGSFEEFTVEIAPDNPWLTTDGKAVFTKDMNRLILFAARKDKTYKIPDGVKIIGKNAFMGSDCVLEELILPDGLEVIEEQAFSCSSLEKTELPDSVRVIGEDAFCMSYITDIRLSKGLEVIGKGAFDAVHNVNELYFHSALREVGERALPDRIGTVKADDDCELFTVKDGILYSKDMKSVVSGSIGMGESIVIHDGVETIREKAFRRLYELKEVKLPPQLSAIEDFAFEYCNALEKINLENVVSIGTSAFSNTGLKSINVSCGILEAFDYCHNLKSVTMKNTQIIGNSAFCGCYSLEEIIMPEGLREIHSLAFSDTALKRVVIPKSVKEIEDNAFDVRYIEIYDMEHSPVARKESFSSKNHLLTVRSEETDEVKFIVPVYTGEKSTALASVRKRLL